MSKVSIYRKKSATKVQSKFAKEKVVRYRQEVGELIRLNLLKTTQSSLLKTTIDDEQMSATAVPDTQVRQPLPSRITPYSDVVKTE